MEARSGLGLTGPAGPPGEAPGAPEDAGAPDAAGAEAAGEAEASGVGMGDGRTPVASSRSAMSIGCAPTPAGTSTVSPTTAGQPLMPAGDWMLRTSSPVARSRNRIRPSYVAVSSRSLTTVTAPRTMES